MATREAPRSRFPRLHLLRAVPLAAGVFAAIFGGLAAAFVVLLVLVTIPTGDWAMSVDLLTDYLKVAVVFAGGFALLV